MKLTPNFVQKALSTAPCRDLYKWIDTQVLNVRKNPPVNYPLLNKELLSY